MAKVLDGMDLVDDEVNAPDKTGLKRYPFVFLVDVSGSTGDGADPDIGHINTALANIMDILRNPTPGSELARQVDHVDVCLIAYSDDVNELMGWKPADKIPATIPHLVPMGGTSTAKAVERALERIGDRLSFYKMKNKGFGMPHIIHFTDGAMNDAKPGEARWNALQSKLTQVDGRANSEKRIATMMNFIAPKGCEKEFVEINGNKMSGADLLALLCGPKSIYEMGKEVTSFESLVYLITVTITKITKNFGTKDAMDVGASEARRIGDITTIKGGAD
jgi:uncharacterized protein YegL